MPVSERREEMREYPVPVPEYVLMVGDLLDHGDNVHDAELDLCPDLHDAAVHRDELLRWHADPNRTQLLGNELSEMGVFKDL
jgi:hypothetical protein